MSTVDCDTEDEILATLVDHSPLYILDLVDTVDQHPIIVDQTCARLHEQGFIYSIGPGLYEVTEAGKQRAESERES